MSSTNPYAEDGPSRWELKHDAIEWLNRSGWTPVIYRGLTMWPFTPSDLKQLTWHFGLHYRSSPESFTPHRELNENLTISSNLRSTIKDNLDYYKDYTVEVPEGVNLQQFIREHEAEVVDPLMYTWVRTVTHKDWDNLEVKEVPLVGTPLRTEHKNPELDQKVTDYPEFRFDQWKVDKFEAWLQEKGLEPTVRNVLQAALDFKYPFKSVEVDSTRYIRNFVNENNHNILVRLKSGGLDVHSRSVPRDYYDYRSPNDDWLRLPSSVLPEELVGTVAERRTIMPDRKGKEEVLEVFLHKHPWPGVHRPSLWIITKFLPAEDAEE